MSSSEGMWGFLGEGLFLFFGFLFIVFLLWLVYWLMRMREGDGYVEV